MRTTLEMWRKSKRKWIPAGFISFREILRKCIFLATEKLSLLSQPEDAFNEKKRKKTSVDAEYATRWCHSMLQDVVVCVMDQQRNLQKEWGKRWVIKMHRAAGKVDGLRTALLIQCIFQLCPHPCPPPCPALNLALNSALNPALPSTLPCLPLTLSSTPP